MRDKIIKLLRKPKKLALSLLLPILVTLSLSACNEEPAKVTLQLREFSFERVDDLNRFTHDREFREHSGTGVTLNRGKVCIENNKTCVEAEVNYRVNAGSIFLQQGHHFATPLDQDVVTLEYWGIDDTDNPVHIFMSLKIDGENVSVN